MNHLVLGLVVLLSVPSLQVKSTRPVVLDFEAPPSDMRVLVGESTIILLGEVIDTEQKVAGTGAGQMPVLRHSVRVLEVLKGPGSLRKQQTILVSQPGGIAVLSGVEHRVDDRSFQTWAVGDQYLWFLVNDPYYGTYAPKYGPGTAFQMAKDKLRIPPAAKNITALEQRKDMPAADLIRLIRSHIKN